MHPVFLLLPILVCTVYSQTTKKVNSTAGDGSYGPKPESRDCNPDHGDCSNNGGDNNDCGDHCDDHHHHHHDHGHDHGHDNGGQMCGDSWCTLPYCNWYSEQCYWYCPQPSYHCEYWPHNNWH